ncbi:MAG: O-antigen ligase family protein [Elusimicrobia bacterium]|nr:O-antigen ligase family protein [Elusimicrobiota bacterium]
MIGQGLTAALTVLAFILPISIAGTNMALFLIGLLLLAGIASRTPLEWRRACVPAFWCLCIYCAVAVVTSLTGVLSKNSLHDLHKDLHKFGVFLGLLVALRAAPARRLPGALALGFTFIAGFGIAQFCLDAHRALQAYGTLSAGIRAHAFVHPVTYGEILALGLLGALSAVGATGSTQTQRRPALAFLALGAAALILNQTRGALLGVAAGFAALCAAEPSFRRWLKWGVAAAVLGAILMELLPTGRSLMASVAHHGTAVGGNPQLHRFILWDVAWRIFKDHPWLGVGPANYATVFAEYHQGMFEGQSVWGSAHNLFLHQSAERGLLGLAALAALWTAFLAGAWKRARALPDAWNLWALAATAAFFVMNFTETAFQIEQVTTLFLLIWARAEARHHAQT